MDNLNEKVWFVYVGDHHEGPFSINEIKVKISSGEVAPNSYTWKEGMGDWELMEKIPSFSVVSKIRSRENEPSLSQSEIIHQEDSSGTVDVESPSSILEPMEAIEDPSKLIATEESKSFSRLDVENDSVSDGPYVDERTGSNQYPGGKSYSEDEKFPPIEEEIVSQKKSSRFVLVGFVLVIVLGVGYLYQTGRLNSIKIPNLAFIESLMQKIPFLKSKQIELDLPGLSVEEVQGAQQIAGLDLKENGPQLGIFIAQKESPKPIIYLVSNLPDGAQFNILLEGKPGTLVNRLNFEFPLRPVVLTKHVSKSEVSQEVEGGVIPVGLYSIYAFNTKIDGQPPEVSQWLQGKQVSMNPSWSSLLPKDRKIMIENTVFLGGQKDSHYHAKLDEYLKERNQKSNEVFSELAQFFETIKSHSAQIVKEFNRINKIGNRNQRTSQWDKFSGSWHPLVLQFTQTFSTWDEGYFKKIVFYVRLHKMIKETTADLSKLFELQTKEIQKNKIKDKNLYVEEIKKLEKTLFKKVQYIDSQIKKIKAQPQSTDGLPKGLDS